MSLDSPNSEFTSFFGPSEPNWAKQFRARRLIGTLNLTCLLSQTTYISDNDISDNANFFLSFQDPGAGSQLYRRVKEFADLGFVKLLLRDENFRPHGRIQIHSFSDVFRAWKSQDPTSAWIVQEFGEERERYFAHVDSWARGDLLVRYPYRTVKSQFMGVVRREALSASRTRLRRELVDVPNQLQSEYFDLIDRVWFSLTDINRLFQDWGMHTNHPLMLHHGMLNQVAFSSHCRSSLVGVDESGARNRFTEAPRDLPRRQLGRVGLEEILDRAEEVLDGPSLAALSVLRAEEVAELRKKGDSYFALLSLSQDPEYWEHPHPSFGSQFVRAAVAYWGEICDYTRKKYSPVFERPTRLAVFLGYEPRSDSLPPSAVSIAVEAGLVAGAAGVLPVPTQTGGLAKSLLGLVRLRFLFLTTTEEFDRITHVLPRSSWFRRSRPGVLS